MGAALSYYTFFSIAPLLVIVIAIAGFFFDADAVRGEIIAQLADLLGEEGGRAIEAMLQSAREPGEGAFAALVSVVLLVLGATTVLAELQSDLDRIWRAPALAKTGGIRKYLRSRLVSIVMILSIAFVLLASLVFSAALAALGKWWGAGLLDGHYSPTRSTWD